MRKAKLKLKYAKKVKKMEARFEEWKKEWKKEWIDGWRAGLLKAKEECVLNLHEAGFSIADIARASMLSEKEVNEILNR